MNDNGRQMLESALGLIKETAKNLKLSDVQTEQLMKPEKIVEVNFPVEMDSGETHLFHGYRVQHNSVLGPYKGGIRFHPDTNLEEVRALATLMSLKCSVAGLPLGGGKAGVTVDPKKLSATELERLARAFARAIAADIGPERDVPAPDVNTNGKIMEWMVDEYLKVKKVKNVEKVTKEINYWRATFTGKPVEIGGSLGRTEATGRGGVIVLQALLEKLNKKMPTVAVQGFGNVGYFFSKLASEEGFRIVAVSDSRGGVHVEKGLDPQKTLDCKKQNGKLAGCYCRGSVCDLHSGREITNEELLELPVDVLVPAALENVINADNMKKIRAKIIVEMANGPVSEEAYHYLTKKGVIIVPDILANSGGVIVSYLEWKQGVENNYWSEEKVNAELKKIITKAFATVWERAQKEKTDLKRAAFETAIKRIVNHS